MKERIFNIFLFVRKEDDVIEELGVMVHRQDGNDRRKLQFLQGRVAKDFPIARRFPLPEWCVTISPGAVEQAKLTLPGFQALYKGSRHMHVLEELFEAINAPRDPIMVITPIVGGKVMIEAVHDLPLEYPQPL